MKNSIIDCIKLAIKKGFLKEPFNALDVYKAISKLPNCNYGLSTLRTFLPKHRKNNPNNETELFDRISEKPIEYKVLR